MNQAREGVLATRRAPEEAFWERGHHVHADTPRKPLGNTARPLEVARSDIIICERHKCEVQRQHAQSNEGLHQRCSQNAARKYGRCHHHEALQS